MSNHSAARHDRDVFQHRFAPIPKSLFGFGRDAMVAIQTRTIGDVYVLDISGKMTLGDGTTHIRHIIERILQHDGKKIILNLTGVQRIDGSGVGDLIKTFTRVAKAGEEPRFLNVTKRLWEFLVITRLLFAFRIYDSDREAVTSFA